MREETNTLPRRAPLSEVSVRIAWVRRKAEENGWKEVFHLTFDGVLRFSRGLWIADVRYRSVNVRLWMTGVSASWKKLKSGSELSEFFR